MVFKKRILYIGGGREVLETLKIAKSLGLEILYIQQKEKFSDSLLPYVDKVFLFDYKDKDCLLSVSKNLYSVFPFDTSISLSEDALVFAALVRDSLGLPGNPSRIPILLKDKYQMRMLLNGAGVSPVNACIGKTLEDIKHFVNEQGFPCIVKPVDAAGSWGIICINDEEEVKEAWKKVQELGLSRFLIEEYLEGPEYSVETFSFHGKHIVIAVTEKITSNFMEIGHAIPAQLSEEKYTRIVEFTKLFLNVIQFEEGPAHTEIKLTNYGPRIVESHDRPGGGRISKLIKTAYGLDIKAMTLGWLSGLIEPLEDSPLPKKGSALRVITPPPGIVKNISGVEEIQQTNGIIEVYIGVEEGSVVGPIRKGHDRIGWIITEGYDVHEAISRCEKLINKAQIHTETH